MMPSPLRCLLLLSMLSTISGVDLSINNVTGVSTKEEQGPRANKRQVKLYSGVRPTPIRCNDEGFQEDPVDCSIFHRCVISGKGRFVSFRFQCSPGTIYDPDTEICNHPEKTTRVACGGKSTRSIKQVNDNEINREIPTPISTKSPIYNKKNHDEISSFKPFYSQQELIKNNTKYPWQSIDNQNLETSIPPFLSTQATSAKAPSINLRSTSPRSISFNKQRTTSQSGEICTTDGFMGDSENCRKFYRCVGNQRGGFIKYEFLCSDPTIWDEDKGACNHVWNVKRRRCGRGNVLENDVKIDNVAYSSKLTKTDESVIKTPTNTQTQTQINYGSKVTQTQSQISGGIVKQNQTQINYDKSTETKQNQTQISYGTAISQSQSQINYGTKETQTQLQINHLNNSSQMQNQVAESTSKTTTTTMPFSNDPQVVSSTTRKASPSNECTENGFIGDSNDCKKFYRCVDNGNGSYTRYEFSCGEGTVWDPILESCNHAWAVKECGNKGSSVSSTPHSAQSSSTASATTAILSSTSSTQNYYTPDEPITEDENDISYGNQQTSSTTSKPISPMSTISTQPTNDNQCKSSGFIGDNNDCKKFYRCVDSGNGQYTRYEFTCGEGTVWDPKIEACNHAWAVEKCGDSQNNNIEKEEITTTKATQVTSTPSSSISQVSQQNDEYDTGYGSHQDGSTSEIVITLTSVTTTEITTTTTTTEVSHNQDYDAENICKTSGFMSDNRDCKKFYRCVDTGNGSYTRYEFSCGEGTVWDSKNQVCNHVWAVEKCGGSSTNEIETTSQKEIENITSSTTSTTTVQQHLVTDDEDDMGYGQQSNVTHSSTATTTQPQGQSNNSNLCTSSGFMGDSNDCKKFYRCVDNGNGGFTKYEFTCGEGTVWDSDIEACNHAWAVEKCGSSGADKQPETTPQAHPTLNDQDYQGGYPIQNDEYTKKPEQSTLSSDSTSSTSATGTKNQCRMSGFMGDPEDCKKFYRCVEDGNGGFIQYEFTCGEGTVWDESIESCNHEWVVNCNCNQSGSYNNTNNIESISTEGNVESEDEGKQPVKENSTPTSSTSKPSGAICKQEGFYGDENDCKKFYRCVNNGQGGYTKYEFTCGEGTVWNQEIQTCDHELVGNSCKSPVSTSSTKKPDIQNDDHTEGTTERLPSTSSEQNKQPEETSSDDNCLKEGFYGDSKNCKKFYRCVNNGQGSFTKYEFTCGEGTVWVQEIQACDHDNGITSCATEHSTMQPDHQTQSTTQSILQSQVTDKENGENTAESTTKPSSGECTSEGFHGSKDDCTKFYRCVDNGQGSFTKYDFTCGEGTAWDSDIQTCNHITDVSSCKNSNQQENQIMHDEEASQTTESTSTTTGSTSSGISNSNNDVCYQEGYYGNTKDCTKFYRCVDNGKGGLTKYDFDCGEGTIWDQDITTCNHPQDVANPSCDNIHAESASTESASTSSSVSQTTSSSVSQTTSSNGNTTCSQESSSKKPDNQNIKCEKAGFYADPNDCKKFYRCVDWDGNGERFSVYHFECGEGTIWDPQLDTCNHEDSVYPPRNCDGTQNQGENTTQENTTTEKTTTQESTSSSTETTSTTTTTQIPSSSEQTTQESKTTEQSTTQSTTSGQTTSETTTASSELTTEQLNNEPTTTTQPTIQEMVTATEQTTQSSENTSTQQSPTSAITTTQESTTSEGTTTQKTTTNEVTTTQQTTTNEQTTTQQLTTEQTTSEQTTDSENTTTQITTTEQQMTTSEAITSTTQLIEQLTTQQQTTENQGTTTDSITESNTQSTTEMTESDGTSTSESDQGTTAGEASNKECPDTEDDQYLYVCPTSFRRHPKYCNMFYQCTEDDDSHETKIATFTCPNNTIYDESKIQCVEEDKADKKCDGQIARKNTVKRLKSYSKDPMQGDRDTHKCSTAGYHQFEKKNECSLVFLKCSQAKSGKLSGYVYQCPEGYVFWSISKKCEKRENMKHCQESSSDNWSNRWEIPIERRNVAK